MEKRKLGGSGLEIAPLMFGGNVFGWTADEATSFALLDAFVGEGFNAIDTADVYSRWIPGHVGGESEAVIGKWLAARGGRDRVVIATKVGMDMGEGGKGLSRAHIVKSAEASLKRLRTDHIDLYQSHEDDAGTPLDETLEAYDRLIQDGKVRAVGASNYDAARLREALAVSAGRGLPRYETLQPHYNLYDRAGFEDGLADACREAGIGVIPYFGLARGFLTGKYRSEADLSKSPRGGGVKRYLDARGFAILAALDKVSAELGATPAQVALAWLMTRVTAPIASATSVEQFKEIAGAARLVLGAEARGVLDEASAA
ncbi:alcohol dehydrogenase [Caulobacter sp. CCUG 60055]|uniref:aldo/keto reductase n=1 Tax=Caulobacter sp. CCUG 60055 TaxID=2100090 RepID=UPI001FA7E114|nr:aldo/keto reductase [Caulobacter sp. CCUG 60055]MCI3181716.1 alcohol dehydrogenase [Caulobacter sp. CCUG 60055]